MTFAFQGGEPTLAGISFFQEAVRLQKQYGRPNLQVHNVIQTNGTLLNLQWVQFLKEHHFLVGISLDGNESLHNLYRQDLHQKGSYSDVMGAIELLRSCDVPFNILIVVTAQTARRAREIYRFFDRKGLCYQQYIPCIDPMNTRDQKNKFTLTAAAYGKFLCTTFDLWYKDKVNGKFVYNRYFENLLGICLGRRPEACGMLGHCGIQYAVEADGSVYPCDFYMLDDYRLGNFNMDAIEEMDRVRKEIRFLEESTEIHEDCLRCRWHSLCKSGCKRDRIVLENDRFGKNRYCEAYRELFEYAVPKLVELARKATPGK